MFTKTKFKFLYLLFTLIFIQPSISSHEIHEFHELCELTTDYNGCIEFNRIKLIEDFKSNSPLRDWRSYGPLRIDWSRWHEKAGIHVVPALNPQNKLIFLALSCTKKKINITSINGIWKNWQPPINDFEFQLFNNYCQQVN